MSRELPPAWELFSAVREGASVKGNGSCGWHCESMRTGIRAKESRTGGGETWKTAGR